MSLVLAGILAYILIQLVVGLLVSRRVTTESDYLLAGRRLGYGLATFSIFATWFGAETCIGAAGAVYQRGLSAVSSDPFGYAGCLLLMGLVFAVPLWRRGLTTLADLFRLRFGGGVERLAVLMMVPTSVLWAAAQVRAFGQVLAAASGWETATAVAFSAVVVILYTAFGGLLADAVTDLVQGIAIAIGLVILLFAALRGLGGAGAALQAIDPSRLHLFGQGRTLLEGMEAWAVPICGSVVAQELVARVIATRSPRIARRATLMGAGIYIVLGLIPVFIGLVAVRLVPQLSDPEHVLTEVARTLLPPALFTIFAGALMSAILSTVDSCLLSASALTAHNLILPLRPKTSEKTKLRFSRAGVVLFGVVAYLLALNADGVYALVEEASAFGSAGIFVIVAFGLFTRFGGSGAACAALTVGMVSWLIGSRGLADHPYLVSLVLAAAAYVGVAALTGQSGALIPEQDADTLQPL